MPYDSIDELSRSPRCWTTTGRPPWQAMASKAGRGNLAGSGVRRYASSAASLRASCVTQFVRRFLLRHAVTPLVSGDEAQLRAHRGEVQAAGCRIPADIFTTD